MQLADPINPPLSIGAFATLACLWEATAAKPGNVYRGADFEDLTYADFVTSAAVIGPVVDRVADLGVGGAILAGVAATRQAVATNSNLGMLLLITPLAAVSTDEPLTCGITDILTRLTHEDARHVYEAIRLAVPGGLGRVEHGDVQDAAPAGLTLRDCMQLAADRDLIARQYVNDFADVFWTADRIQTQASAGLPLGEAIVRSYLELLARCPDSLIARKCGADMADLVSSNAAEVLVAPPECYNAVVADFDFWLRADGHRRNPGTTADVIAAALFVLLREHRLNWPVRFY